MLILFLRGRGHEYFEMRLFYFPGEPLTYLGCYLRESPSRGRSLDDAIGQPDRSTTQSPLLLLPETPDTSASNSALDLWFTPRVSGVWSRSPVPESCVISCKSNSFRSFSFPFFLGSRLQTDISLVGQVLVVEEIRGLKIKKM